MVCTLAVGIHMAHHRGTSPLFLYPLAFGVFHLGALVNEDAVNIVICAFLDIFFHFFWLKCLRSRITESCGRNF